MRSIATPDAQGLDNLDIPAAAWVATLSLPPRVDELLLLWICACASAYAQDASMLEFLRWISAAGNRVWQHLEAAVLGWRLPHGTAALYEAIAADVSGEIVLGAAVALITQGPGEVTVRTVAGDSHGAPRDRHGAGRRAALDQLLALAVGGQAARR